MGPRKRDEEVFTEMIGITPEQALQWLDAVPEWQRKVDRGQVEKLKTAIKNNEWKENGATIVFDSEGNLLDGQHRLHAISESGKTVNSLVVTGVAKGKATFQTIGDEKPRKAGDFIKAKYAAAIAGVGRIQWLINHGHWPPGRGGGGGGVIPPIYEVVKLVEPHIPFLEELGQQLDQVGRLTGQKTWCMFLVYYYTKIYPYKVQQLVEFFTRMGTGENIDATSPIYRCRQRFLDANASQGSMILSRTAKMALIAKALNYYFDEKKMTQALTYSPSKDAFPILYGTKQAEDSRRGPKQERADATVERHKGKFIKKGDDVRV